MLKKFLKKITGGGTSAGKVDPKLYRASRVKLPALSHVFFRWQEFQNDLLKVANISMTGLGILRDGPLAFPEPGGRIAGHLIFEEQSVPVAATIVHVSPSTVGCRFEGDIKSIQGQVARYFAAELSALQL